MKSEIIFQGENKRILLTPENNHEKFFIEKNAILKTAKDFDIEFRFEQLRENSIDGITFNHCIIISNEKTNDFEEDFEALEKEEIQKESFIVIDYLEMRNYQLKAISITLLIIIFFILAFSN